MGTLYFSYLLELLVKIKRGVINVFVQIDKLQKAFSVRQVQNFRFSSMAS